MLSYYIDTARSGGTQDGRDPPQAPPPPLPSSCWDGQDDVDLVNISLLTGNTTHDVIRDSCHK